MRPTLALALFALAPPCLLAQKIGAEAPDIRWERNFGFGDIDNQTLSELRGSVIVLEFWTTYSTTCVQEVPRLNKMFAERAASGLVVIGVTGDDSNLIPAWMKKHEVKYPCVTSTSKEYSVRGIPEAVVIDKDFKIAWRGHPAAIEDTLLDRLLVGAKPAIVLPGLEEAQVLRKGGDFGGAWKKTKELLDGGKLSAGAQAQAKEWQDKIEAVVKTSLEAADKAEAAGDVYGLWAGLDPVAGRYLGAPGTDAAKARLDKLLADPKQKREIDAGRKVAEGKAKEALLDYDGAYEVYKVASAAFANTKAGKAAIASMRSFEKDGKLGYQATCPYCKAGGAACPTHKKKKK